MKREPSTVCALLLRAFLLTLVLAAGTYVSYGAVIASSNFNSSSSADSFPAVTWTPTLYLGPGVPTNGGSYVAIAASGTVDATTNTGGTTVPPAGVCTNALKMNVNFTGSTGSSWQGAMQTPILSISNLTALDRLNVSFDLVANRTLPIRVKIESFTAGSNNPTGALEGLVVPPIYNSFYHYSVDLSSLTTPAGSPTFVATDARVRFSFFLDGGTSVQAGWPATTNNIISVDNICYNSPTRWVHPKGDASLDGTSPSSPTTVAHAFDLVQPGDVICFLGGTYSYNNIPSLQAAGTPARWITLRSSPGGTSPVLMSNSYCALTVSGSSAYIDIHGFTIQGIYDQNNAANAANQVASAQADARNLNTYAGHQTDPAYSVYSDDPFGRASNIFYGDPQWQTSGINLNGRQMRSPTTQLIVNTPPAVGVHHVRIADNVIMDMPGAGIGGAKSDYVYVEHNTVTECGHLCRSGVSGITFINELNFDGDTDTKMFIVGNEVFRNRGDVQWVANSGSGNNHVVAIKFSDGNGVIVDINLNADLANDSSTTLPAYQGRTLVQNNISHENGGSGIHALGAAHVDVLNNTAFNNNQPNKAAGTVTNVTWTQSTATVNSYPAATYTKVTDPANRAGTSLGYGEIFAGSQCQDVHIFNNIAWAPANSDINAAFPYLGQNVSYDHNVFGRYGSDGGLYTTGFTSYTNNTVVSADPLKVFASVTVGASNSLHLKPGPTNPSPAINAAVSSAGFYAPADDFNGDLRPKGSGFDIGAYEDY